MKDLKNIGESRTRKMQKRRSRKQRIDLEFCAVAILIIVGMTALVINW